MNDSSSNGIPVLVGLKGEAAQTLERISLDQKGEFNEAWLQELIHDNPSCLPISEIEPGLDRFVAICREMRTPRNGLIDNLLMTGKGDIAFVETKLFRNPEARRKVVAQTLDYATSLFEMSYDDFEKAVLKSTFSQQVKPSSLYETLEKALTPLKSEMPAEAAFVDAVTRNLRRGRALILIAGDGIREEAEGLLEGLHMHARFGFVFALIELGVFRMPDSSGRLLVRPRTLVKTSILRRPIVVFTDAKASKDRDQDLVAAETLSEENYWQKLEAKVPGARTALEKLIRQVEPLKVNPDFLKSLILRWDQPGLKPISLGQIASDGAIWTDNSPASYAKKLADAFNCDAHAFGKDGALTPYKNGRPLQLASVIDRLDAWVEPMRSFTSSMRDDDGRSG